MFYEALAATAICLAATANSASVNYGAAQPVASSEAAPPLYESHPATSSTPLGAPSYIPPQPAPEAPGSSSLAASHDVQNSPLYAHAPPPSKPEVSTSVETSCSTSDSHYNTKHTTSTHYHAVHAPSPVDSSVSHTSTITTHPAATVTDTHTSTSTVCPPGYTFAPKKAHGQGSPSAPPASEQPQVIQSSNVSAGSASNGGTIPVAAPSYTHVPIVSGSVPAAHAPVIPIPQGQASVPAESQGAPKPHVVIATVVPIPYASSSAGTPAGSTHVANGPGSDVPAANVPGPEVPAANAPGSDIPAASSPASISEVSDDQPQAPASAPGAQVPANFAPAVYPSAPTTIPVAGPGASGSVPNASAPAASGSPVSSPVATPSPLYTAGASGLRSSFMGVIFAVLAGLILLRT